ncbi:divalent-cation tolerance protein CutA [Parasphingorhabdus sp. JC815]|uniref:divalent-cation tolerance protein CutA n=1 Tax=Parasphingorhabdus sp. JC815 TaxID=3232140 RepID=UPI00345AD58B
MTGAPTLIYTTFESDEEAKRTARILIDERLVACANHLAPATSQYIWEGTFCEDREYPVLLKTTETRAQATMARLRSLHSYDTPAILCWTTDYSDRDYAKWLSGQITKPRHQK